MLNIKNCIPINNFITLLCLRTLKLTCKDLLVELIINFCNDIHFRTYAFGNTEFGHFK